MGEITYAYDKSYRTGIISIMEMTRILGLAIGPVVTFAISKKVFHLWQWRLDYTTMPGLIMAFIWLLYEAVTICFVSNVSKEMKKKSRIGEKSDISSCEEEECSCTMDNMCGIDDEDEDLIFKDKDTAPLLMEEMQVEDNDLLNGENHHNNNKSNIMNALKEMMGVEFVVLIYVDCVLWLVQTDLEIFLPFLTEFEYKWSPKWTGLAYTVGGSELIIVFLILVSVISRFRIRDSYLLIVGSLLVMVASILFVYEGVPKKINQRVVVFVFIYLLGFASLPFNQVASKAILTKICRPESQGFIQGFYASVTRIALIVGPIIWGFIVHQRQMFGSVSAVASLVAVIGVLFCVPRLKRKEEAMTRELEEKGYD